MKAALLSIFGLSATLATASPRSQNQQPYCSDGGQLHCCAATFNGGLAPIKALSSLACYDLTPATTNCIIVEDSSAGCTGTYSCCQVNDLVPVIGLFCSAPPGGCVGKESDGACTNILDNKNGFRFGQCTASDVNGMRNSLGLGPLGLGIL